MKILKSDLKHGIVKLRVENLDDMWYLSHVIGVGDTVKSVSYRRIKDKEDQGRSSGGERRPVTLKLGVEKTEFKSDNNSFRISGTITEGPEDIISIGSYHTFSCEPGTVLTIGKSRWSDVELQRLKDAEKSTFRPKLLIVVVDEGHAHLGLIMQSQIKHFDVSKTIGGKYDTSQRKSRLDEFYHDVGKFLTQLSAKESVYKIILAGPGFEKENLNNFLIEHYPDIAKNSVVEHIGSTGANGVKEVLRRDETKKIFDESASVRDICLVETLLEHIGKDTGMGVYGPSDVEQAMISGAVETIIVADDYFMENRGAVDLMMQGVRKLRGQVHIVNHESDAGKQLKSLGSIAAILRFKVQ